MSYKRPKGVTFIGYFYIFGAVMLLLSLAIGTKQAVPIGLRFGVPNIPESIIITFIAIMSLVISYGYLRLKKWGYWSMLVYTSLFLLVSLTLLTEYNNQPFIGNAIWSIIVIIYTYRKRTAFYN